MPRETGDSGTWHVTVQVLFMILGNTGSGSRLCNRSRLSYRVQKSQQLIGPSPSGGSFPVGSVFPPPSSCTSLLDVEELFLFSTVPEPQGWTVYSWIQLCPPLYRPGPGAPAGSLSEELMQQKQTYWPTVKTTERVLNEFKRTCGEYLGFSPPQSFYRFRYHSCTSQRR